MTQDIQFQIECLGSRLYLPVPQIRNRNRQGGIAQSLY